MTRLLVLFDAAASAWWESISRAAWHGTLAIAAAWLLCRLFHRLPPRFHCWIWRVAVLKLLLAFFLSASIPLPVFPPPKPSASAPRPEQIAPQLSPDAIFAGPAVESPALPVPSARRPFHVIQLLFLLWLIGAFICLAALARQWWLLARLRKHAEPVNDPALLAACDQLSRHFVLRAPRLLRSSATTTPLLTGTIRPAIVLPDTALSKPRAQVRLLIAHELAHHRRRDLHWNWLFTLAHCLFFFHPLIHLARRQWRLTQELSADELALAATRAAPADYAKTLLDAIPAAPRPIRSLLAVGVVESYSSLERRLLAMEHSHPWNRRAALIAATALLIIATVTLIPWHVTAQQAPTAQQGPPQDPPATTPPARADLNSGGFNTSVRDNLLIYAGVVTAPKVEIRPQAEGLVVEISVKEGERIKRGQRILLLDDLQQRIGLDQSRIKLMAAKTAFERISNMHKEKMVSVEELQQAELNLKLMESELQLAEQHLIATRLTAPIDGVISSLSATVGQFAAKGSAVATLIDVDSPRIQVQVAQDVLPVLEVGRKVRVTVPGQQQELAAQIDFISPEIDPQSRLLLVKAKPDSSKLLRPGMMVHVEFPRAPAPAPAGEDRRR